MSPPEAREAALERLYEADQRHTAPDTSGLRKRASDLVTGVWDERDDLDAAIGAASKGWKVSRMPPVDRNILRMALWELRHHERTPVPVVISEAVRLAKRFSTERSGGFVNGVLSNLASERSETAD